MFRILSVLLFLCVGTFSYAQKQRGGYFELSGNAAWYKYNNGTISGDPATTTRTDWGSGIAYRFLSNTGLEIAYQNSYQKDQFTQDYSEFAQKIRVLKKTRVEIVQANLILEFADRKSSFRPYIKGGGGYMIRKTDFVATQVDKITGAESSLTVPSNTTESVSAQGGIGMRIFIADSIAIETTGMMYASDLDEDVIYTHYSVSAGLRYLF